MDGKNSPIDQNWGFCSIDMDDMLTSIYSDPESYNVNRNDSDGAASAESAMTLEDFMADTGAFGTSRVAGSVHGIAAETSSAADDGLDSRSCAAAADFAAAPDKAAQGKLRRMRKNRESAARSRERRQAYTMGLESMVSQLKEDNVKLLKDEAERNKEKYKQLMNNMNLVVENLKPSTGMRKVCSMEW